MYEINLDIMDVFAFKLPSSVFVLFFCLFFIIMQCRILRKFQLFLPRIESSYLVINFYSISVIHVYVYISCETIALTTIG